MYIFTSSNFVFSYISLFIQDLKMIERFQQTKFQQIFNIKCQHRRTNNDVFNHLEMLNIGDAMLE